MASNKSRYKRIIILLLILIVAVGALVGTQFIMANLQYFGLLASTPIVVYIISAIHMSMLKSKATEFV